MLQEGEAAAEPNCHESVFFLAAQMKPRLAICLVAHLKCDAVSPHRCSSKKFQGDGIIFNGLAAERPAFRAGNACCAHHSSPGRELTARDSNRRVRHPAVRGGMFAIGLWGCRCRIFAEANQ